MVYRTEPDEVTVAFRATGELYKALQWLREHYAQRNYVATVRIAIIELKRKLELEEYMRKKRE